MFKKPTLSDEGGQEGGGGHCQALQVTVWAMMPSFQEI